MPKFVRGFTLAAIGLACSIALAPSMQPELHAQDAMTVFPRTKDGKPDLTGVWQALNTAAWDMQDHTARMGFPGGQGVVEGNKIPYLPAMLARKKNAEKRDLLDPEAKCYLPGVPRATYMPFPFQIVQSPQFIAIGYEFADAARRIYMDGSPHPKALDFWMGD